jgi:integrase
VSLRRTRYPGVYRRRSRRGQRFDTFTARVHDPNSPSSQRWVGSFPTARAAYEAKLEAEREKTKGLSANAPMTVAEYAKTWLDDHPRSRSTLSTYKTAIKPFLAEFGDRDLRSISRIEARRWGKGVTESNLRVARSLMNDALDDEKVDSNPLIRMKFPRGHGRRSQTPPSVIDVVGLADTAREMDRSFSKIIACAIEIGFSTLMRPGEQCAIGRSELDLKNQMGSVVDGMDRFGVVRQTKTKSEAMIALVPSAVAAIEELDEHLPTDRSTLFLSSQGNPLRTQTLNRYWNIVRGAYAEKVGKPELRDADFYLVTRHAGATFMRNVLRISPDDVEAQLRHRGANLINLYTHPDSALAVQRILAAWPQDLRQFARDLEANGG